MHFLNLFGQKINPSFTTLSCLSPMNVPLNIAYERKTQGLCNTLGNYGLIISKVI